MALAARALYVVASALFRMAPVFCSFSASLTALDPKRDLLNFYLEIFMMRSALFLSQPAPSHSTLRRIDVRALGLVCFSDFRVCKSVKERPVKQSCEGMTEI